MGSVETPLNRAVSMGFRKRVRTYYCPERVNASVLGEPRIRDFRILGGEVRFAKNRLNQTKCVGLVANMRT